MVAYVGGDELRYTIEAVFSLLIIVGSITSSKAVKAGTFLRVLGYLIALGAIAAQYFGFVSLIDELGALFTFIASFLGLFASLYTVGYARAKFGNLSLQLYIDSFALTMMLLFFSRYLIEFVVFWVAAEVVGFFVIIYEAITEGSRRAWRAGLRFLLVSMIPADISIMTLLALAGIGYAFGIPFSYLFIKGFSHPVITVLVIVGFLAKAAVAPLHFWLPEAHSIAPAPGSALLSGMMVKMGIYGILRVLSITDANPEWLSWTLIVLGSITIIYGGLQALAQTDIKRILAYSTTVYTSIMCVMIGLYVLSGDPTFIVSTYIFTIAHAIFKAALFLDSGIVEAIAHTRILENLGYISKIAPTLSLLALVSVLSLIGIPPTAGFLSKLMMFLSIAENVRLGGLYVAMLVIVAIGAALSVGYGARYLLAHWGRPEAPAKEVGIDRTSSNFKYMMVSEAAMALANIAFAFIALLVLPTPLTALEAWLFQVYLILTMTAVILAITMLGLYQSLTRVRHETPWLGGAKP